MEEEIIQKREGISTGTGKSTELYKAVWVKAL